MAINITQIETVLVANGFTAQPDTNKKYRELVHHDTRESVYLNKAAPGCTRNFSYTRAISKHVLG